MQSSEQIPYWIWLSMVRGIGNHFFHKMIRAGSDPKALYHFLECSKKTSCPEKFKDLLKGKKLDVLQSSANAPCLDRAKKVFENCLRNNITVCIFPDKEYPDRMRNIDDMPAVLYVRGRLKLNQYIHTCGIIGARRCTRPDMEKAVRLAENACRKRVPVISGMAKGIDGYAQTAAILNHGYTAAVLGNGPDICYPPEHNKLMEAIAEQGAVLSAYMPGTTPRKYYFPARNKIIAALSDSLIIIGAGRNSGTRTTAEFYRSLGKEKVMTFNT